MKDPHIDRRWIYQLALRHKQGKNLPWDVERILKEAQVIEFKEHPQIYTEWMGKQINFK